MLMQSPDIQSIDDAIAEVTGLAGGEVETVWVYGVAFWCQAGRMVFSVDGGTEPVTLVTSLITRYRDGESSHFLVELPRPMAEVLGIDKYALDEKAVEAKMRNCERF
jgi:hypothetical protein